ncbi:MAG: anti-sigma factor antagonist [Firmicutes bacterium]|nr:anti-sigma factor antagonist [Bacillota bacterium]
MPENTKGRELVIALEGRIDSGNSAEVEERIFRELSDKDIAGVVLDAEKLSYISSAGLRVILRVRKNYPDMKVVNVCPEVYDILDMTGFTEMMTVERAYRVVNIEGCEEIGRGANGTIYRIDKDNVVKVYNNADALEDIRHEREVAKLALILGIPTAISYDVVKVGESYGSVFELLNASSFSKILATEPEKMDWCVKEYVEMLKKIQSTLVPKGKLPDIKDEALKWARFMKDHIPEDAAEKLLSLVEAVPHDDHMVHGDYHTKNLMLQGDEVLLIDMDTLAIGHPIFELAAMFNAFTGFSEYDHNVIKEFQGFDFETGRSFWLRSLAAYLGTDNEKTVLEVEDKARVVGYARIIRRSMRHGGLETEKGRAEIEFWKERLIEVLGRVDSLVFERNELDVEAEDANIPAVLAFLDRRLEEAGCPMKLQMQIDLAVEEIFVNIAHYAYAPGKGRVKVNCDVFDDPRYVQIRFTDSGIPYDPLEHEDPDVTLSAEERQIGGLGIYLVKQAMDDVQYEYKDGQNILTLKKFF